MYAITTESISAIANDLPSPTGYKVLIAVAKVDDKKGNILLPDAYKKLEDTAAIVGYVMALGPDAYLDSNKFPSGPFCSKGEWVMFKSYSGTRFKVGEQEFRLLNDDEISASVPNPAKIERV